MFLFSVNAQVEYNCKIPYNVSMYWNLYLYNSTTLEWNQMNITDNPTWQNSEILITGNTLDYGMYKFEFFCDMFFVFQGQYDAIQSVRVSYIQIIPTQIAVFAIEGGMNEINVGYMQPLELGNCGCSHLNE